MKILGESNTEHTVNNGPDIGQMYQDDQVGRQTPTFWCCFDQEGQLCEHAIDENPCS